MARSNSYTYDNVTGNWILGTEISEESPAPTPSSDTNSSSDNLTSSDSDKNSSTGAVEKKYNTIEVNTLQGTLSFIANEKTIKLKAGNTVKLEGLGKYLSGDYYVKEVNRRISASGYEHSAVLIKTDFGNSLKVKGSGSAKPKEQTPVASPPQVNNAQRTYTVKKGDTLWKIAKQFYNDGKLYNKIYDANTGEIADPDLIYIGQVFVIP